MEKITYASGDTLTAEQINDIQDEVLANKASNHTHENITALDNVTNDKVTVWDGAGTNSHFHGNKTVLDQITVDRIEEWNSASGGDGIGKVNRTFCSASMSGNVLTITLLESITTLTNGYSMRFIVPTQTSSGTLRVIVKNSAGSVLKSNIYVYAPGPTVSATRTVSCSEISANSVYEFVWLASVSKLMWCNVPSIASANIYAPGLITPTDLSYLEMAKDVTNYFTVDWGYTSIAPASFGYWSDSHTPIKHATFLIGIKETSDEMADGSFYLSDVISGFPTNHDNYTVLKLEGGSAPAYQLPVEVEGDDPEWAWTMIDYVGEITLDSCGRVDFKYPYGAIDTIVWGEVWWTESTRCYPMVIFE